MRLRSLKTHVVTFWFLSQTPMCWVKKRIKGAKNEKEELRGRELWPNSMPSFPWITMVSSSFPLPACDCTLGPIFFQIEFFYNRYLDEFQRYYFWYLSQYCKCYQCRKELAWWISIQFHCRYWTNSLKSDFLLDVWFGCNAVSYKTDYRKEYCQEYIPYSRKAVFSWIT